MPSACHARTLFYNPLPPLQQQPSQVLPGAVSVSASVSLSGGLVGPGGVGGRDGLGAALERLAPRGPAGAVELDVAAEYRGADGCWRSHSTSLALPLRHPFRADVQVRCCAGGGAALCRFHDADLQF